MLGDKLLTDMLGANLNGCLALMVEPMGGAVTPWQKVLHAPRALSRLSRGRNNTPQAHFFFAKPLAKRNYIM